MSNKFILSKSNAMLALNCKKALWNEINNKANKVKPNESQELLFKTGNEVGKLAHKLFSKGIEVTSSNQDRIKVLSYTNGILKGNKWDVLFEGGFIDNTGNYCRVDILEKVKGKTVNLYEVKSSTAPKEQHYPDLSFQASILRKCGYKINDIKLTHIRGSKSEKDEFYNKDGYYYFNGKEIEVEKFFKTVSLQNEINEWEQSKIKEYNVDNIDAFWDVFYDECKYVVEMAKAPKVEIGNHCSKPYECPFSNLCHNNIQDDSIYHMMSGLNKSPKKIELLKKRLNIKFHQKFLEISMKEIPDDMLVELSLAEELKAEKKEYDKLIKEEDDKELKADLKLAKKQIIEEEKRIKAECLTGIQSSPVFAVKKPRTNIINEDKIIEHFDSLQFPLNYTDFETIAPSIPIFKDTHSNQRLPFQYILYIQDKYKLDRTDYLYNPECGLDPREAFIIDFIKKMPKKGSVIVWNKTFELGVLKELGEAYPDYADDLKQISDRVWDLMTPFQKKWYINPKLLNSYSIKKVLALLASNFSYHDIDIQKGDVASAIYEDLLTNPNFTKEEKLEIERQLKDYCGLDGLAMVKILEKLAEMIGYKI